MALIRYNHNQVNQRQGRTSVYLSSSSIIIMALWMMLSHQKLMTSVGASRFSTTAAFVSKSSSSWKRGIQHQSTNMATTKPLSSSSSSSSSLKFVIQQGYQNRPKCFHQPQFSSFFHHNWALNAENSFTSQQQQLQQRNSFSTTMSPSSESSWTVPQTIEIPEDQLEISFTRSSGAGGQNVNKVNTKVELKLHVMNADWIPMEVRERLSKNQSNKISKEGYLTVTAQEYRTQAQNRKAAVSKLQQMVLESWPRPKVRKQRKGISKAAKERNKEFKKHRSDKKASRGRVDF